MFDFGDVAQGVTGGLQIAALLRGRSDKENPALRGQMDALRRLQNPAEVENLARLYEGEIRRDLVDEITRVMLMNRREKARGGVGFGINPERRDESRFRALLGARQQAGDMARDKAMRMLAFAAGGYGSASGAYENLANYNQNMRSSALEALNDAIMQFGNTIKRSQAVGQLDSAGQFSLPGHGGEAFRGLDPYQPREPVRPM